MVSGRESSYQQLYSEITVEFNNCSKEVCDMESQFLKPNCSRDDFVPLLRVVQEQEKQKLYLMLEDECCWIEFSTSPIFIEIDEDTGSSGDFISFFFSLDISYTN